MIVLALSGCASVDQEPVRWLEGFRFSWDLFNHRLAHLEIRAEEDELLAAFVGGTSTTGVAPSPLPDGCAAESCVEFPFTDLALLDVGWVRVDSDETAFVAASIDLEVEADRDATVATSAAIPRGASGEPIVILRGWRVSTDHPLAGEPSCYDPGYGWHPQRIAIVLGEAKAEGDVVTAEVTASFTPGASLDPARGCIDDVVDRAVTEMTVDVWFAFVPGQPAREVIHLEAAYPFSGNSVDPGDQPEVAPVTYGSDFAPSLVGWSAIDFRFDPSEDRGAYLRTLAFEATPTEATGWANNFSPGTQLEDFAYTFDGVLTGFEVDGEVTRGATSTALVPELDAGGDPVVHPVGWGSVRP